MWTLGVGIETESPVWNGGIPCARAGVPATSKAALLSVFCFMWLLWIRCLSRECVLKLKHKLENSESLLWLRALIIYKVVLVVHGP